MCAPLRQHCICDVRPVAKPCAVAGGRVFLSCAGREEYSYCSHRWPWFFATPLAAQTPSPSGLDVYHTLQRFELSGGSAVAENMELTRDRVTMVFNGRFYFELPVAGRVRGAVFLGQGTFRAEVSPLEFERENVHRMLKADVVESDFRTAVLRFSDDTFDHIGKTLTTATAPPGAQELAAEFQPRI